MSLELQAGHLVSSAKLPRWQRFSLRSRTVLVTAFILLLLLALLGIGWQSSLKRAMDRRWVAELESAFVLGDNGHPPPTVIWMGRALEDGSFESIHGHVPRDADLSRTGAFRALSRTLVALPLNRDRVVVRQSPAANASETLAAKGPLAPWIGVFSTTGRAQELKEGLRTVWGSIAGLLALGSWLLFLAIGRLHSPLKRLTRAAEMLPTGEDSPWGAAGHDEVEFLEEALQRVTTRLSQLLAEKTDRLGELEEKHRENLRLYEIARHEIRERRGAEAALSAERARLARRVRDRTADLSAVNAELAKTAKAKDEFLASMSHELRTPLNAILGLSEALRQRTYGPLTERQAQFLKDIEDSGRHLLALINDILDVARVGAENLHLELQLINVAEVGRTSIALIKQSAMKKRIRVEADFDPVVETLEADIRRLKQILVNLLSNAVKFTPEGGSVGLEVRGDPENRIAHFIVSDTGIGIAQEDLRRLFQPFVQLDSRLARQYEGTGLGLSLVYHLAEMHGGGVTVDSIPGEGSRFRVSLPWNPRSLPAQEPRLKSWDAVAEGLKGSPLILVAEDNRSNVVSLTALLEASGARVMVAENGRQALDLARRKSPDLIIMDIQMPELDGLEVIGHLRDDRRLRNLPVIALTALAMPGDRERCLAAGANDYLSKPVPQVELIGAVRALLERRGQEHREHLLMKFQVSAREDFPGAVGEPWSEGVGGEPP